MVGVIVLLQVQQLNRWFFDLVLWFYDASGAPRLLYDLGYTSIGCEPCTTLPIDPNNPRSGRWQGEKLECGIHVQAVKPT